MRLLRFFLTMKFLIPGIYLIHLLLRKRHIKIVEIYAQIYLKMVNKRKRNKSKDNQHK